MLLNEWGGPEYEENVEDYINRMESSGFTVHFPTSTQVFIDIDTEEQYETFKSHKGVLAYHCPEATFKVSVSRNGLPGRHIVIELPFQTTKIEKIALQAAMGSDPLRELLSFFRYQRNETPTIFVEKGE